MATNRPVKQVSMSGTPVDGLLLPPWTLISQQLFNSSQSLMDFSIRFSSPISRTAPFLHCLHCLLHCQNFCIKEYCPFHIQHFPQGNRDGDRHPSEISFIVRDRCCSQSDCFSQFFLREAFFNSDLSQLIHLSTSFRSVNIVYHV